MAPTRAAKAGTSAATRSRVFTGPIVEYRMLAAAKIRSDWQYRTSFLVFIASNLIINVLDFVGIAVLFSNTESLGNWTLSEVAFLYGVASICFGLADLLVGAIENVPTMIKDGSFDVLLTRPVNVLINLSASDFSLRRLGKISQGAAVFAIALAVNNIDWTFARVAATAMMLVVGTTIACATWVITSSVAFWLVDSREVGNAFTYGGGLAVSYPVHVFDRWLRVLLTYVFPLIFVSYLPALYILDISSPLGLPPWLGWCSPIAAAAMVALARWVWRLGLRRYSSTGS